MMIIHALGVDKCVVVVFLWFLWKWVKSGEV